MKKLTSLLIVGLCLAVSGLSAEKETIRQKPPQGNGGKTGVNNFTPQGGQGSQKFERRIKERKSIKLPDLIETATGGTGQSKIDERRISSTNK